MLFSRLLLVAVSGFILTGCASTDGETSTASEANRTGPAKAYNYEQCLVIEKPLTFGGGPFTRVHEGREVKFCCRPCIKTFEADPKIWMAKLDRWDAGGGPTSSPAPESGGE